MALSLTADQTSLADRKRRAGQRLVIGIAGKAVRAEERELIAEIQPAGFILFARNVDEPAQVWELHRELRALVRDHAPPLCTVDHEGGRVQRVRATAWPPLRQVGNADDVALTAALARAHAEELRAMGFDLTWAPVADVDSNPKNPVIGDRSFGDSADVVARHVAAFITAATEAGLGTCVKHFPGHGDTDVDSHLALPTVERERPDIERLELPPFRAAIRAGVPAVMTAHVMFPAYDDQLPATLSERLIQGVLREQLGFQGVVVSDDLEMKAVRDRWPLRDQLDLGCRAGLDMFLVCESPSLQLEAWEALVRLQEDARRHDTLATDSVARVHALRERLLVDKVVPPLSVVGSGAHAELAQTIAARGRG